MRSLGTFPIDLRVCANCWQSWADPQLASLLRGRTNWIRLVLAALKLGVECVVVAPTLVPMKAGDRVKTDRRDAERLAKSFRAGDLTAVWVPDAEHEALRDLVRAREAAKKDQLRARHRLGKFLLRHGRRPKERMTAWTQRQLEWIRREVKFEPLALRATLEDYLEEVDHLAQRIVRLERTIDEAIEGAPATMRAVVGALQALQGVGKMTAITPLFQGADSRADTADTRNQHRADDRRASPLHDWVAQLLRILRNPLAYSRTWKDGPEGVNGSAGRSASGNYGEGESEKPWPHRRQEARMGRGG